MYLGTVKLRFDDALIGGRVMVAVPGARVLPDGTLWLLAGAPACLIRCIQGNDRQAETGIVECSGERVADRFRTEV